MTFRKPLWLLCGERLKNNKGSQSQVRTQWQCQCEVMVRLRKQKFTNLGVFWRQNQLILETESKRKESRWLLSFSQLARWLEWLMEMGKKYLNHHCLIEAGLVYFFKREDGLRIKVTHSSDAVYHYISTFLYFISH